MKHTPEQKLLIKAHEEREAYWKDKFEVDKREEEEFTFGEDFLTACCKVFFEFPGRPQNSHCNNCYKEAEPLDPGDPLWQEVLEAAWQDEEGECDFDNFNGVAVMTVLNPDGVFSLEQIKQLPENYDKPVTGWENDGNKVAPPIRKKLSDVQKRLKGLK